MLVLCGIAPSCLIAIHHFLWESSGHCCFQISLSTLNTCVWIILPPDVLEILRAFLKTFSAYLPFSYKPPLALPMVFLSLSFAAAEEGKPVHVPRVKFHGNIHFWNYDRPERERRGSFLVLPLQDSRRRAFGILGLDTLRDQCEQTIFLTHEISFYQVGTMRKAGSLDGSNKQFGTM